MGMFLGLIVSASDLKFRKPCHCLRINMSLVDENIFISQYLCPSRGIDQETGQTLGSCIVVFTCYLIEIEPLLIIIVTVNALETGINFSFGT